MYKSKIAIAILVLAVSSPVVSASPQLRWSDHNNYYSDRNYDNDRYRDNDRHDKRNHQRIRYAKVVHVKPIYKTVRIEKPRRHCETYQDRGANVTLHQHSPEAVIMGGVVGGIVGHELGRSGNREISTLAGIVIGSAIAHDVTSINHSYSIDNDRSYTECHRHTRVIEKQKLTGYKVKYKYRGQIYTTRMRHHPGKRLPIQQGPKRHSVYY